MAAAAPLLWPTTTVSSSTPSPRRKGTHLRARATSSRLEPRDAAVRLMFARDDRVGHHLWQDDLVEEAGVVQSALEPAVPVFEFAVQGAAPGDDDAADHDGWVFEATATYGLKRSCPGPCSQMLLGQHAASQGAARALSEDALRCSDEGKLKGKY